VAVTQIALDLQREEWASEKEEMRLPEAYTLFWQVLNPGTAQRPGRATPSRLLHFTSVFMLMLRSLDVPSRNNEVGRLEHLHQQKIPDTQTQCKRKGTTRLRK
jgi:hypothetical protein